MPIISFLVIPPERSVKIFDKFIFLIKSINTSCSQNIANTFELSPQLLHALLFSEFFFFFLAL